MRVGEHPAGMLGELGEHRIFLGRQMDLLARPSRRRAGTGRSSRRRPRPASVGRGPELDADWRDSARACCVSVAMVETSALSPDPLRLSSRRGAADRRQPRPQVLADRRQQGRAQPVALAQGRRTPAPRLRAGRARAPARSGRAGCRAAAAALADRRRAVVARQADRGDDRSSERIGWNCHSAVTRARQPAAGGFAGLEDVASGGDVARRQRRASPAATATMTRLGQSGRPAPRCNRTTRRARSLPTSAISSSRVQDSSRRAKPAMVALRAACACGEPRLRRGSRRRAGW